MSRRIYNSVPVVFVTGGIGAGKSAVCSILSSLGIPVYDSDSRTKSLYDTSETLVADLEKALCCGLRDSEGRLDRKALSGVVFSDPQKLSVLESIVHPAVLADFQAWRAGYDPETVPFVVMESAIVLDKPLWKDVADFVVVVDAPVSVRLKRACRRDGVAEDVIRRRMECQNLHLDLADAVVVNDCPMEELRERTINALSPMYTDKT